MARLRGAFHEGVICSRDDPGSLRRRPVPAVRIPTALAVAVAQAFTIMSAMADESGDATTPPAKGEAIQKVLVEAQRSTEALARGAQREAPNVVNLMTAEAIKKLPDVSVGEALGRVPGVSLEYDTGEGRYINIRGIDSDGAIRVAPLARAFRLRLCHELRTRTECGHFPM